MRGTSSYLSHVRQQFEIELMAEATDQFDSLLMWAPDEAEALARAIRGHPTISGFGSDYEIPFEASLFRHWEHCQLWNRLYFVTAILSIATPMIRLIPRA